MASSDSVFAQHFRELRDEHDGAAAGGALERDALPVPAELRPHMHEPGGEVAILPPERQSLADPELSEQQNGDQRPEGAAVREQLRDLVLGEDPLLRARLRGPFVTLERLTGFAPISPRR